MADDEKREQQPQEKSVERVRGAVIMRDKGRILPGQNPNTGGRKAGGTNKVRGDMKEEYAAYCELMGTKANLLLFYESVRINEELPVDLRLKAADSLARIVFPVQSLVTGEKTPVSKEMEERGKKLTDAIKSAFTGGLPMLEAPPNG
jgi:hypothetical protein